MEMRDSYSVDMKRDYHEGFIEREKGEEEESQEKDLTLQFQNRYSGQPVGSVG